MSDQDPSLNFEDLLETVKESERGRWFVREFETRLRKSDTGNILSAIQKLEGVIASQSPSGIDGALVARARSAIATARREIAGLDSSKQQLSDEGRLFAKLSDMARSAFSETNPGASLVNAGVSRALLLVDQLDQDFGPASLPEAKTTYFPPEAGVFETPAPEPRKTIAAPASLPAAATKDVERGARLVIRKAGEAAPVPAEDALSVQPVPMISEAAAPPAAEVTLLIPAVSKTSRVVIIRRKPEELLDVPLVDEAETGNAA